MIRFTKPALAALALLCASASSAHFLWATHQRNGFLFEFAETPGDSVLERLAGKQDSLRLVYPTGHGRLETRSDSSFLKTTANQAAASLDYGVLDRTESGRGIFRLLYYVKAAKDVVSSQKSLGLPLELFLYQERMTFRLKAMLRGQAAPGAEVVYGHNGSEMTSVKTDAKGFLDLQGIKSWEDLHIRAMAAEQEEGLYEGKAYTLVRHYSSLAFTKRKSIQGQ